MTLTLAASLFSDDVVKVSYVGAELRSRAGAVATDFLNRPAVNSSAAGCSTQLYPYDPNISGFLPTSSLPSTGLDRAVMLFVDFPDAVATTPAGAYAGLASQISSWYRDTSYGRLRLQVDPQPFWVRMPQPSSAYSWSRLGDQSSYRAFIHDAVAAADPQVDFSGAQVVYVVPTPAVSVPLGDAAATASNEDPLASADGAALRWGAVEPVTVADTGGLFIHETGHFLGLPDLYGETGDYGDLASVYGFVGSWDIMSDTWLSRGFLGWQRRSLGWIPSTQLRCLTGKTLETDLEPLDAGGPGVKLAIAQLSFSKALVVEQRQPTGPDGHLCTGGILVYTVDESIQTFQGPFRLHVAKPDTDDRSLSCGYEYNAPYDVGGSYVDVSDVRVDIESKGGSAYRVRLMRP